MNPPTPADPLAALRDYHLPQVVSWWPPAPGWWLLAVLILLLLGTIVWWGLRRWRRRAAARLALRELAGLRVAFANDGDATVCVRGLSKLLRRYALAVFPRQQVAGVTGDAWLVFLDAHGSGPRFTTDIGRQLLVAPYRRAGELAVADLADLVADWIRRNHEVRG